MASFKHNFKTIIGVASINVAKIIYGLGRKCFVCKLIFIIFRRILRIFNLSLFPIENYVTYKSKIQESQLEVIATDRVGVSSNIIMADSDIKIQFHRESLPDLLMLKSSNVCIQGNSDVIVDTNNDCVISDASYNVDYNIQIVDGLLYRTIDNVCILRDNLCKQKEYIDTGIMISGKFCNNYYHVLLENLIKLLYIEQLNIPFDVPIVVDFSTMDIPSLRRIFELLSNNLKRKVITIKPDKMYKFNTLYSINNINKIASHLIDNYSCQNAYLYWTPAINDLCNKLLLNCSERKFPKRVFITRAYTSRRNYNENEVYEVLVRYGFEKVAPELLTFEEQMSLFNNAEYIISGSGAALTNLLFVNKNCTIICFGISSKGDEIPVFNTIANIKGAEFIYFPRKTDCNGSVHSNFEIDCSKLHDYLKELLKQN